ncbi:MAG: DNA-processing protein DprA [Tannerella sp.]|jgi:DNA processing protein|nr:DNA-processing protein DprA [Tannerella sp.]
MAEDKRIYLIGLTLLKGIGDILARQLLCYFGDEAEGIFHAKKQTLEKAPGIGALKANAILQSKTEALRGAEKELSFIEKKKLRLYTIADADYPARLRECPDAPIVFYFTGNADLNAPHVLSIVGTRNATDYGVKLTTLLLKELSAMFPDLLVVSGLAYGIDICAHRSALKFGLPTVGVLAHGLDRIYPSPHRRTAVEMLERGGLLTDFVCGTAPDRENFLRRNRLIAGLAEATIVAESAEKGGALITADIAFSYGREVYAFPGRVDDVYSGGCNRLIQKNKAGLITSAADLVQALNWDLKDKAHTAPRQSRIVFEKERPKSPVLDILAEKGTLQVNDLSLLLDMPVHQLSPVLFELELAGHIKVLPGGLYKLNF